MGMETFCVPTVVLDLYLSFVRAGTHTMRILPAFPHHSELQVHSPALYLAVGTDRLNAPLHSLPTKVPIPAQTPFQTFSRSRFLPLTLPILLPLLLS